MWATALVSPPARPDLLPVEGAVLRADEGLPAMLQEGLLSHLGDGRIHLQNSTGRGESRMRQSHLIRLQGEAAAAVAEVISHKLGHYDCSPRRRRRRRFE